MLKNLIKLLVSLSLISSISYGETTENLVSQNFTTGWSGTNLSSTHGSSTIAGVHNGYVESDAVSLNSLDINKESLNEGLTITGSANYYFWSGAQQSVTQTIKTVDDNGNIITQTRIVSGTSGSGTTYDQLIIGSNSQQDYDVSLRYDFSIPTYPNYHYAADLNNPSLTVSYTYVPPMDAATQTALLDLNKTITDDLKDVEEVKIESKTVDNKIETPSAEPQLETQSDSPSSTTSDSQQSAPQESVSSDETSSQESQKSDQVSEEKSDDKQEATSESNTSQDAADTNDKQPNDQKNSSNVSLSGSIGNINAQVKDPGKIMENKSLEMLDKMIDNSALNTYANIPFYKFKDIYTNQVNIRDNRVLYADASLISYKEKDPIFKKQNILYNIKLQKQKLINEIMVLKNGQ